MARGAARPRSLRAQLDTGAARLLVDSSALERIAELSLVNATDETVVALAGAPLAELRSLSFWQSGLGARAFEALGARLDRIERLSFTAAPFDPAIVPVLMRHLTSGALRRLDLAGFTCDALADLVASPVIAGVEELDLTYGPFSSRVADALMRSPHRGRLRRMWIVGGEGTKGFRLDGVDIEEEGW
jgi:hypothetical protein